tara:strand:- start:122 stop:790 length:669 start_codon:yes stop_codon:yes gene_type:complete
LESTPKPGRKGQQTRQAVLDAAIALASSKGLEGLTIGALAERLSMSKSGVYAHCVSREELQIAVLREYEVRFVNEILKPSVRQQRGLARLRAIFGAWLERTAAEALSGCIMISGAVEYDDRPGAVRDELVRMVRSWQGEVLRAIGQCKESGELVGELDEEAFGFELTGVILALHHDARLLNNPRALHNARLAFERLVSTYANPAAARTAATSQVITDHRSAA